MEMRGLPLELRSRGGSRSRAMVHEDSFVDGMIRRQLAQVFACRPGLLASRGHTRIPPLSHRPPHSTMANSFSLVRPAIFPRKTPSSISVPSFLSICGSALSWSRKLSTTTSRWTVRLNPAFGPRYVLFSNASNLWPYCPLPCQESG